MRGPLASGIAALAALLAPLGAPMATAADPAMATCAGKPATMVVSSGTAHGTPGEDVVVAAAGTTVLTGGGNDLICSDGGTVKAGAGKDRVVVTAGASGGTFEMGQGRDSIRFLSAATGASLYLYNAGTRFDGHPFTLANVERYYVVGADEVTVVGSGEDDWVTASGCIFDMLGGYGNDTLRAVYDRAVCPPAPDTTSAWISGGPGDDRLIGTSANDVLSGARGQDHADGRGGRDICRAELERHCEGP